MATQPTRLHQAANQQIQKAALNRRAH